MRLLLLLPFLLSACSVTRPAGTALVRTSHKIAEAGLKPDSYIQDRQPKTPFLVKCVVRPVTIPVAFGGVVVAAPFFVTGIILEGPAGPETPEETQARIENENAAIAFKILTTPYVPN